MIDHMDGEEPIACSHWDNSECAGSPYCPPRCPRFVDKHGTPVIVRPAEMADREVLMEMYSNYDPYSRSMGLPPCDEQRIAAWLSLLDRKGFNLIACADDVLVGHCAFTPTTKAEPELVVFVRSTHHDSGIGSELVRHAIAYAADAGHRALVLDVERRNQRAIHVYKRLGFVRISELAPEIQMRLPLTDPVVDQVQLAPGATANLADSNI